MHDWLREGIGASLLLLVVEVAVIGCSGESGTSGESSATSTNSGSEVEAAAGEMQTQMDSLTRTGYFPGIVTLARDHATTVTLTSGVARTSPRQAMSPGHRFPIASITKSMVAAMTFRLIDEDRLDLDATVATLHPGLLLHGRQITIAHLLSHRSGLPDPVNDPRYQKRLPESGGATAREVVRAVADAPLDFPPGSAAKYSNTNYEVLGILIEGLTRKPLEQTMRQQMFSPLDMTTASFTRNSLSDAPLAHGYFLDKDVTAQAEYGLAAGGAVMHAADVNRFLNGLFYGDLVSQNSLTTMTRRRDGRLLGWDGYGYGLAFRDTGCGRAYGHSGRVDGYVSEAWAVPTHHTSVVVLANRDENGGSGGPLQPLVDTALCGKRTQ